MKILGSLAFWSGFGKTFLAALGGLWLIVDPITFLSPDSVPKGADKFALLLVFAMVIAIWFAWPRRVVSASIPGADVKVTILVGDLFDAKDNVVIGVNDVFDTHIGDDIISPRSVQAQFVQNRLDGSVPAFDRLIEAALEGTTFEVDPQKTRGKNARYPMGTVIETSQKGIRHFLSAYCRMGANLKAQTSVCTLIHALDELWEKVRNSGQNQGVSMPVLGSDFGRIGLTQTQLIQILVLSFVNANRLQHVAPELTIYVYEGHAGKVDFAALRLWLRGVLWA